MDTTFQDPDTAFFSTPQDVRPDPSWSDSGSLDQQFVADDDDDDIESGQIRFKMAPEDFPDGVDWSTQTVFSCYLCGTECDGFRSSVGHIRQVHADSLVEDKAAPCIVCPKLFARMDHLKNHVWSHVNKVKPDGVAKHSMTTFVRSTGSRASLKHRLFDRQKQEHDDDFFDQEEEDEDDDDDDKDFDSFLKSCHVNEKNAVILKSSWQDWPSDVDWSSQILVVCRICQKECDGFSMAAAHMKHIHPDQIKGEEDEEWCPVCPKAFKRKDHLKNHLWRHVNRVYQGTPKHTDTGGSLVGFGRGKPSWTEEKMWQCRRCDKQVKGISEFVQHLDTFHPNQCGIVCPVCDKELPSKRRLKVHMVLHSDKKATCPHCGKDFTEEYKLKRHVREVHDHLKDHVCSTCGKSFARADKLFQHELVHVPKSDQPVEWVPIQSDVPIPQEALKMSSSDESSDSSDSSSDNELLPEQAAVTKQESLSYSDWTLSCCLTCITCAQVCRGFKDSLMHMKRKHPLAEEQTDKKKAYRCLCCPKSFARRDNLKNHLKRHVFGIKSSSHKKITSSWAEKQLWQCKRCERLLKGISKYVNHVDDLHPNEDKLMCPLCDKAVDSNKELKSHVLKHKDRTLVSNTPMTVQVKQETENGASCNEDLGDRGFLLDSTDISKELGGDFYEDYETGASLLSQDSDSKEDDDESSNDEFEEESVPAAVAVKRPRGRPRKHPRDNNCSSSSSSQTVPLLALLDPIWENFTFICFGCNASVKGFQESGNHMAEKHQNPLQCIQCWDKLSSSKSVLKRHVYYDHLESHMPKVPKAVLAELEEQVLDFEDELQQQGDEKMNKRRLVKENRTILQKADSAFEPTAITWSDSQEFTCHICAVTVQSFDLAVEHMHKNHEQHMVMPSYNFDPKLTLTVKKDSSSSVADLETLDQLVSDPDSIDIMSQTMTQNNTHEDVVVVGCNDVMLRCIECPLTFKGPIRLKIHMWRHFNKYEAPKRGRKRGYHSSWAELQVWTCKRCPVEQALHDGISAFVSHMKLVHASRTGLMCPVCDKDAFHTKEQLRSHLQSHNHEKPACTQCGKTFFNDNKLKRHIAEVHEGKKNHMCNQCGKRFSRPDKLRDHERVHLNGGTGKRGPRKAKVVPHHDKSDDDESDLTNDDDDEEDDDFDDEDDDFDDEEEDEEEEEGGEEEDSEYFEEHELETEEEGLAKEKKRKRLNENNGILQSLTGHEWSTSFKCHVCQETVDKFEATVIHMKEKHPPPSDLDLLQCILCSRSFKAQDYLKVHLWRHANKRATKRANKRKRRSGKSWAESRTWPCKKCNDQGEVVLEGLNAFIVHQQQVHNSSNGLVCPTCDKDAFLRKEQLRFHLQNHHEVKLPCEFCGKLFPEGNKMKRHVSEVHEGKKNHKCKDCGKRFARLEKLRAHEYVHMPGDYKPFLCHRCGRGFGRQEHVSRHQKICGKKKNKCKTLFAAEGPISDEEYERVATELGINDDNLEAEPLTNKYPCRKCNKSFRCKRYIIEHYVRNHREANLKLPHRCEVCGKGFKVIRDLIRHHNRPHTKYFHSEEYLSLKHMCPEDGCARRFRKERALKKHMLIHNNIRNFKCDQCNMAFCTKQTLRSHMKAQHNVILPIEPKKGRKLGPRKSKVYNNKNSTKTHTSTAAALNLSQNNQEAAVSTWVPQGLQTGYFSAIQPAAPVANFPNWMNLDQPPTMASYHSNAVFRAVVQGTSASSGVEPDQDSVSVISEPPFQQPPPAATAAGDGFQEQQPSQEHQKVWDDLRPTVKVGSGKKRSSQPLLTAEQKQIVTEEMVESRLGALCNVCGKIFKNKEALDFHIMYTKLPGHDLVVQQRVRNNYAQEAMRVSAKLQVETGGFSDDYGPPTPTVTVNYEPPIVSGQNTVFDASTGVFVKQEPKEDNKAKGDDALMPPPPPSSDAAVVQPAKKISRSKIFKCMECHRGFKKEMKLVKHVMKKHNKVTSRKTTTGGAAVKVKKEENVPVVGAAASLKLTPMGCPDCSVIFACQNEMMAHFEQPPHEKSANSSNKCPVMTCDMNFQSRAKLVQHLKLGKHGQACPQCGKSFPKLDNLEIHVRSHTTERPFACEHCDKTYKDAPSLYSHLQTHNGKRSHLCSECGASFMKSDHLKRHINSTHRKIKNIKCHYCDMMFSDKYKAKIHERKHTGETPYLCQICAKAFKRKEALDNHAIVHKDLPKDFKCVTCGAAFNSQQYLNRHISRHFAEKKHKCRDCDMAFIDKRDYVVHVSKVHGNHRPFGCSSCGMAYKTKQGLSTHLKSYPTGQCVNVTRRSRGPNKSSYKKPVSDADKPFVCEHCYKRFAKKSRLEWHERTHTNERPTFACATDGCDKAFFNVQAMKAHLKQVHPGEAAGSGRVSSISHLPQSSKVVVEPAAASQPTPPPPPPPVSVDHQMNSTDFLPASLQEALSQHQRAVGIPQALQQRPLQQHMASLQASRNPTMRTIMSDGQHQPQQTVQHPMVAAAATHPLFLQQQQQQPQQHILQQQQLEQQQRQLAAQQQQQQIHQQQQQHHVQQQPQHQMDHQHLTVAASEFYQHYAANIANFNQMYRS